MKLRVLTLSLSILSFSAGLLSVNTASAVEDKTCEMVNSKMECEAKKNKHTMQNSTDKVEDAVD